MQSHIQARGMIQHSKKHKEGGESKGREAQCAVHIIRAMTVALKCKLSVSAEGAEMLPVPVHVCLWCLLF